LTIAGWRNKFSITANLVFDGVVYGMSAGHNDAGRNSKSSRDTYFLNSLDFPDGLKGPDTIFDLI